MQLTLNAIHPDLALCYATAFQKSPSNQEVRLVEGKVGQVTNLQRPWSPSSEWFPSSSVMASKCRCRELYRMDTREDCLRYVGQAMFAPCKKLKCPQNVQMLFRSAAKKNKTPAGSEKEGEQDAERGEKKLKTGEREWQDAEKLQDQA